MMADVEFDELNLDVELERLLDAPLSYQNKNRLRNSAHHHGFDDHAGATWIYPSNIPLRDYQLNIVQAALFRNTLVVLPTGLGKTFIAAVVMYNIYRWYPQGKVVFMAPTRPLVAQQIDACRRIMPFPANDTAELTGKLVRSRREELWRSKRVFFVTPQVLQSDLCIGIDYDDAASMATAFPYNDIKLLVVDEAHKAKGRYAFVEVAQCIWQRQRNFRILALSATPGRTMDDVAAVVRNLFISHVEVRFDNSIDVVPYVHKRHMRTIVVSMGEQIERVRKELTDIVDPYLRELQNASALSHSSLHNISRNVLIYEQKSFRERSMLVGLDARQQSKIASNFSICISLYHALELLERHGLRVFLNNFDEDDEGRAKFVLNIDKRLRDLIQRLRLEVGPNPFDVSAHTMTNGKIAAMPKNLDFGHPKFEQARQCVLQHFQEHSESRAIVFCEYRESVMLIYRLLLQHVPTLRPRCFVGQGGTTGSLRALTQKQQIEIMNDFRSGKSNILVATCIGEEGIDVGEVDLIVCFDISTSNPTRFIQRIGRTGRQKQGNVVMLVTEGREQQLLKDVLAQKDQANRKLLHSSVVKAALYQHSPRLVPSELQPKCVHTFIKPPEEQHQESNTVGKLKKDVNKKKSKNCEIKGTQDLRKFFSPTKINPNSTRVTPSNSQSNDNDDDDLYILDDFSRPKLHNVSQQPPGIETQKYTEKLKNRFNVLLKDVSSGGVLASNTQLLAATLAAPTQVSSPPKRIVNVRYLRKLNTFMQCNTPILSTFQRITNFHSQLKCKKLSVPAKRVLLKMQPQFVRDILESMRILEVLDPTVEGATNSISPEERDIRGNYELVETICGGNKSTVEKLLAEIEPRKKELPSPTTTKDFKHFLSSLDMGADEIITESVGDANMRIANIFKDLDTSGGRACDNFDYIQEQLKEILHYKRLLAKQNKSRSADTPANDDESLIYNTMSDGFNMSYDISRAEVNNCSHQWNEFANVELTNKSTPLTKPRPEQQKKHIHGSTNNISRLYELVDSPVKASTNVSSAIVNEEDGDDVIFVSSFLRELEVEQSASAMLSTSTRVLKGAISKTNNNSSSVKSVLDDDFDVDMNMFLEPFADELKCSEPTISATPPQKQQSFHYNPSPNGSTNDNFNNANIVEVEDQRKQTEQQQSPNLFDITVVEPIAKEKITLATKLADKTLTHVAAKTTLSDPLLRCTPQKTSTPLMVQKYMTQVFKSPQHISMVATSPSKQLKSPSVFDLYLRGMRGGGRGSGTKTSVSPSLVSTTDNMTAISTKCNDASILHKPRTSKRRIFESDDSGKEEICKENVEHRQHHKKRRRVSKFIADEAAVSGCSDDSSEDEMMEYTADREMLAHSSDEEEGAASTSYMQGVYLQSVKSPAQRRNAFKIPKSRVYNDQNWIYSQQPPVEPSQYVHDSFVVEHEYDDDRKCKTAADESLCPLERAERILKERKKQQRRHQQLPVYNTTKAKNNKKGPRRILSVECDSSTDFESD